MAENIASQVSIVNTVEAMQLAVDEFSEHVEGCNVPFKQNIMEKVKVLKQTDVVTLTERVEELKGDEGSELGKLHLIYRDKKRKAHEMEAQRDRNHEIIEGSVEQWRYLNKVKKLFGHWRDV